MNDHCPVCGQPLDMEPGFYYGTNMISYALAILFVHAYFLFVVGLYRFFAFRQTVFLVDRVECPPAGAVAASADAPVKNHLAGLLCEIQSRLG